MGNVRNWCADVYPDAAAFRAGPPIVCERVPSFSGPNRSDTRFDVDGASSYRVKRGGGWFSDCDYLRLANRYGDHPGDTDAALGFRCAR